MGSGTSHRNEARATVARAQTLAPSKSALWRSIDGFEIDDPQATLPFTARLARENGWSRAFARRAFEEYKRFCYLAMVSEQPVVPSEEVDQVWHQHLTYTRSYWDEFCPNVLGRPLHHGPTRGGSEQRAVHGDLYVLTLELYEREFGTSPPAELWPAPEARFTPRTARVDLDRNWVVPRPRPLRWLGSRLGRRPLLAVSPALLTAPLLAPILLGATASGTTLIAVFGVLGLVGMLLVLVAATGSSGRRRRGYGAPSFTELWLGGDSNWDDDSSGAADGGGSDSGDSGGGGDSGCSGCGGD